MHAYIISSLRKEMPVAFGKESKKKELIKALPQVFDRLQREHQISMGDFPDVKKMQETLQHHDFTKFQLLKPKLLETVDKMLSDDIARLMEMLPLEDYKQKPEDSNIQGEISRRWARARRVLARRFQLPFWLAQSMVYLSR